LICDLTLKNHVNPFFLSAYLEAKGHKVIELKQAKNWNNLTLYVNGENIFKCNLNELEFGGDGQLDPVVVHAEELVKNAF
jgi:hypothetical protein